ncbi:ABC transporter ATP-binding protein [Parazoarcus communis]|uniref:ABC transporter n=1 Tax=Parazoarcus communis SWub3 = DSM 12120 TaxID=1121029 RepID=A0A323VA40_9RHOO|nr:ABC transporter ATP-binding protein [Parazoarcus communis]NMG70465.1 ATP-binding cassette domain-containing protein [Parazoarcus communis SWub3 = DSM 12120]PZA17118.1 ABC transporter [Azoarcus communis] [Parazoarcus communis SWub3 = DSM 12120]
MTAIACSGLRIELRDRVLLDNIDFAVRRGELIGIVGANGAGKSTLFKALIGLLAPTAGQITLAGQALRTFAPERRARLLAYLAQGHVAHWPLSVRETVALGRLPHGPGDRNTAAIDDALEAADLSHLAGRNVLSLSGGERARTMLARALAVGPAVLLADEPLAALDPAHQLRIMALLRAQAGAGMAVGVVLHDLPLAARFCTRLVLLHEGRMLATGTPAEVLSDTMLTQAFGICAARFQLEGSELPLPWQLTPQAPQRRSTM